jgi:Rrf2 family transcriptional regulator, cysteine metabolism repressor
MKISSKTTYGFRFMLSLAVAHPSEYVKLGEVAKQESISEKYLENIVAKIKPFGFIDVKRGAQGGYKLAKAAEEISLSEIFEILEGEAIEYEKPGQGDVPTANLLVINELWDSMRAWAGNFLGSKTLADLAESYKAKNNTQMYFI